MTIAIPAARAAPAKRVLVMVYGQMIADHIFNTGAPLHEQQSTLVSSSNFPLKYSNFEYLLGLSCESFTQQIDTMSSFLSQC